MNNAVLWFRGEERFQREKSEASTSPFSELGGVVSLVELNSPPLKEPVNLSSRKQQQAKGERELEEVTDELCAFTWWW